jgi:hypothetical protein
MTLRLPRVPGWLVIGAAVVLIVRALLPAAIQRYAEFVIDLNGTYAGRVGDVDLNLWRGALEIEDVEIRKRSGRVPVPLFASPRIDVSAALRGGELVGELRVHAPEINVVAGPTPELSQTGLDADWSETRRRIEPLHLDRLEVRAGQFHFRNFQGRPDVDAYLRDLDLAAWNLRNSEAVAADRVARFAMRATPMTHGRLEAKASFDPFAERPSFDLDVQLVALDLTELNDLLRAYLRLDVDAGVLSTYIELSAREGRFEGYVKPVVQNVELGEPVAEREGPLAALWEGIVDKTTQLFESEAHERVAARIPISGTVTNPDASVWAAIGSVLRNAFIKELPPRLEHSVGNR